MKKLYRKSEIWFSVIWIVMYVAGSSVADLLSDTIGVGKSATFLYHLVLSCVAFLWLRKHSLLKEYGLCAGSAKAGRMLYYIPLVLLASVNLWFGAAVNMPLAETLFYIGSMLCVGFLEELIFRGFLFRAMARNNVTWAIIVSSITFGLGHLINLVNGSGAELCSNLCQVLSAMAMGYMFVVIFCRAGTLLPCIATHSLLNSLSAFSNEAAISNKAEIIVAIAVSVVAVGYALVLCRTLPENKSDTQ